MKTRGGSKELDKTGGIDGDDIGDMIMIFACCFASACATTVVTWFDGFEVTTGKKWLT